MIIVDLKDVLPTPQVAANRVSLRALDADRLEYVGKGGMISVLGESAFLCKTRRVQA